MEIQFEQLINGKWIGPKTSKKLIAGFLIRLYQSGDKQPIEHKTAWRKQSLKLRKQG